MEPPPPAQPKPAPAPARRTPGPQPKPADPPPSEPSRPPIQEILPADVQKQFQASAQKHKADTRALVVEAQRRHLTANERRVLVDIDQFARLSDQAEKSGDTRSADQLAERAHILAKELQSGK